MEHCSIIRVSINDFVLAFASYPPTTTDTLEMSQDAKENFYGRFCFITKEVSSKRNFIDMMFR